MSARVGRRGAVSARVGQRGAVLLVSLIVMVVMTLFVLSAIRTSVIELKIGGVNQDAAEAFANAERGTADFVRQNSSTANSPFFQGNTCTVSGGTYNCVPPAVTRGTVVLAMTEIACLNDTQRGAGNEFGNLDALYVDLRSEALGDQGGTAIVHLGIKSQLPAGSCK